MPYNNTPIAPPQDFTGSVSLPLARIKKIIHADDDIGACSNNAAFVIAVATEMFVQHLVEQTHNVVKSERRPRRNIQYRDVASAVSRVDNLEFLTDVVPRTMTYKQYKEKKTGKEAGSRVNGGEDQQQQRLGNGQRTLEQMSGTGRKSNGTRQSSGHQRHADDTEDEAEAVEDDEDIQMTGQFDDEASEMDEGDDDESNVVVETQKQPANGGQTPERGREFNGVVVPTPESRPRPPPARHAYDAVRDRFDE